MILTAAVLRISASHAQLKLVENAIEKIARFDEWPESLAFKVKLAVEEIGLNIIDYGYAEYANEESREIEVRLNSEGEALTIEFIDEAKPFDPLSDTPVPDTLASIEDRPIGGLGVHLVRELMDEVTYIRECNRNRLTLVTRLPQ